MRPIDADALKATMIETLEQIKANPKMDGQEMHIIAGIAMLGEMIDDSPTNDAVPVVRCRECIHWVGDFPGATKYVKRCEKKNFTESGKLHTIDKECARRYLEGKIFFGFIIDAFNRIINRINEIEDVINQK